MSFLVSDFGCHPCCRFRLAAEQVLLVRAVHTQQMHIGRCTPVPHQCISTRRRTAKRAGLRWHVGLTAALVLIRVRPHHCRFLLFEYLALSIFVYFGILSICITPNMPVAYMFSGTVYFSERCS